MDIKAISVSWFSSHCPGPLEKMALFKVKYKFELDIFATVSILRQNKK